MPSGIEAPHDPLETLCIHPLHESGSVSVYDVACRPHDTQRGPEERPLTHQIVFPRRGVFEFESRGERLIPQISYRPRSASAKAVRASTLAAHSEVVQRTSLFLATAYGDEASLADVARAVHASPFHLARLFRRELGFTIHQYRHRLRLRAALERIADAASRRAVGTMAHRAFARITQPTTTAFLLDPDGNNLEAVCFAE